jgi:protein TonB
VSQGVSQGLLVHKVTPEYPPIAKQARMQGSVVLRAVIGKDGKVENVQTESGSPLLASAAMHAVKQWRYKPYVLNGSPVEVETTVTVNFQLAA